MTGTHRVLEAARCLGDDRSRAGRSTSDSPGRSERRRRSEIHDKPIAFIGGLPCNGRANTHTEEGIALCVWNVRSRGSGITGPLHIHAARSRAGAAAVGLCAHLSCSCRVCTNILAVLCVSHRVARQQSEGKYRRGELKYETSLNLHNASHFDAQRLLPQGHVTRDVRQDL